MHSMVDRIGDDGEIRRAWTPARVIGWFLVVVGSLGYIWFSNGVHVTYGMELALGVVWCGAWFLFWSWVAWRRRKSRHDSAETQARAMARWSSR